MVKKCRICANELPEGARKCVKCGEFQSLLPRVLSGIDLKGLIALVPIATLAYVFIQDRVTGEYSSLDVALISCSQDAVTAFVSNTGNRGGVVTGASYKVTDFESRLLILPEPAASRLFDGGESRIVELKVDQDVSPGGLVPFEAGESADCRVDISVDTLAFDHSKKSKTIQCDCPS